MSKELLQKVIDKGVEGYLNEFFLDVSKYYTEMEDSLSEYDGDGFSDFQAIGEINFSPSEKLVVVTANIAGDLTERSGKKAQYEKAKKILKSYMRYDTGIFVFSDTAGNFRLSLVYGTPDATRLVWSNFRRFTYFVSPGLTNKTFLDRVGTCSFASLEIIKDAFSVEKVNKEFYIKIAKFFYRLTGNNDYGREMQLPSVGEDDNKTYEEFAVRLIGRSIFCWFLKHKKSIKGIPLIAKDALSMAAVQNHSNYYHSILEPLFFELMNTPIKDRKTVTIPEAGNVPFLNGGLFEPHEKDFYKPSLINVLKIPDKWFTDFFTVLEQYNFTIDENSAVDADVSVDPEMLGRIFENLLAEVDPFTDETARKATGSFYTPRTIVDYMVEQSLKQYLLMRTALPEETINTLLSYEDNSISLQEKESNAIVTALKEIRIIDPACGSGAFPMGILHRMLLALEKVDPKLEIWRKLYLNAYHPVMRKIIEDKLNKGNEHYIRKLTVIQDSVYGVDIQPIAVEISKLRCFLSLVVDELVFDEEENRGIEPLPNLEFKFVAANSLIGLPKTATQSAFGITDTVNKLRELRESYLNSYAKDKKQIEKDFRATQRKLFEEHVAWAVSDELVKKLSEWNPFSYDSSKWFDPEWMFGVNGGFDIVIANPPYSDSRAMVGRGQGDLRETITKTYSMAKGSWDIYIAFFELGLKIMNDHGVLIFITPDKWISKPFGDELRKGTINKILTILRAGRKVFESSIVDSIISLFTAKNRETLQLLDFVNGKVVFLREFNKTQLSSPYALDYLFSEHLEFLLKVGSIQNCVADLAECENACATDDAYKLKPLIKESTKSFYPTTQLKIINTGTISKYSSRWGHRELTYLGQKYLYPVIDRKQFISLFKKSYCNKSLLPKIIIKGLNLLDASLDVDGTIVPGIPTLVVTSNNIDKLKFLLSIINSNLAFFYIKERYPSSSYNQGTNFTPEMINHLPLPHLDENGQKPFISLVNKILAITKAEDYPSNITKQAEVMEMQEQINQLVDQLYELTPEEIVLVNGKANK
ncbi:Eco57I restriction-modification methylase domain-containing protein [Chloroflexota bacterium]